MNKKPMNKKYIIISFILIGLLFTQAPLRAQTQSPSPELPGAGLTPDSFFYFLDEWGEGIQEFFTFSDEGKAQLQVSLIGERVSEIETMLGREYINPRDIRVAFDKIDSHANMSSISLKRLEARADTALLAAALANDTAAWERFLDVAIKNSRGNLTVIANAEREILAQRMDRPNFIRAMEDNLTRIAKEIDIELGRPLTNFTVVYSSVDVDDDTYSSTHRAEMATIVNLTALRNRILANRTWERWESGNAVLDNNSLDITFEKTYEPVTIDGIKLIPEASVTISVTINSPRQGMTSINYDIDITLETESEQLIDFLEDMLDEAEKDFDDISDEIEERMDNISAARKSIRDAEESKQEIINEAIEEGVALPVGTFSAFDAFLAQAKSAFTAGNYHEARRLANRAENALENVEDIIDELKVKEEPKQKMNNAKFIRAMEMHLRRIAKEIDIELGRPLENFTVVYSSVDVDDDTYSSTHRAEVVTIVNLAALRNRILARGIDRTWESGNVVLDNNSLYITFEKAYAPVTIDNITLTPEASVTINVTLNRPRQGMTFIIYDIDITLETELENEREFKEYELAEQAEKSLEDVDRIVEKATEKKDRETSRSQEEGRERTT